jgi:hypothetical protein
MIDKKKGGEIEKTGEFVSGGVKRGRSAVKRFGKGVNEGVLEKKK